MWQLRKRQSVVNLLRKPSLNYLTGQIQSKQTILELFKCEESVNLAHYFPYDVKLQLLAHSQSFLANQKDRNAIVGAENLLNTYTNVSVKSKLQHLPPPPQACPRHLMPFPNLVPRSLVDKAKARSVQIQFALRDHLSGMWQRRQVRMPNINSEQ